MKLHYRSMPPTALTDLITRLTTLHRNAVRRGAEYEHGHKSKWPTTQYAEALHRSLQLATTELKRHQ